MSAATRCRKCRHRLAVSFSTDGFGRVAEQVEPCAHCARRAAGLCADCPSPRRTPRAKYCDRCAEARRREACRQYANAKRGATVVKPHEWRGDIDEAKRLAGTCQLCIKPVDGKPKVALYCARHRKIRRADAQRKHVAKTNRAAWKRYAERNREKLRQKARASYQNSKRERKRRNDYKREWRKRNRDKVRAQKRRSALRGRTAEAMRRRRERLGDLARVHANPAPRGPNGERLCLQCPTPLNGRAKLCDACKYGEQRRAA